MTEWHVGLVPVTRSAVLGPSSWLLLVFYNIIYMWKDQHLSFNLIILGGLVSFHTSVSCHFIMQGSTFGTMICYICRRFGPGNLVSTVMAQQTWVSMTIREFHRRVLIPIGMCIDLYTMYTGIHASSHYMTLHFISLHCIAWHRITLHYIAFSDITILCSTFHDITLYYTT